MVMPAISAVDPPSKETYVTNQQDVSPAVMAQEEGGAAVEVVQSTPQTLTASDFMKQNWGVLLMGFLSFLELIVRLTPTEKDNSILNFISKLLNYILPNLKKGGERFMLTSK